MKNCRITFLNNTKTKAKKQKKTKKKTKKNKKKLPTVAQLSLTMTYKIPVKRWLYDFFV